MKSTAPGWEERQGASNVFMYNHVQVCMSHVPAARGSTKICMRQEKVFLLERWSQTAQLGTLGRSSKTRDGPDNYKVIYELKLDEAQHLVHGATGDLLSRDLKVLISLLPIFKEVTVRFAKDRKRQYIQREGDKRSV